LANSKGVPVQLEHLTTIRSTRSCGELDREHAAPVASLACPQDPQGHVLPIAGNAERPMPYAQRLLDWRARLKASSALGQARTKHSRYSAASIARRRAARQAIREIRALLRSAATTEDEMSEAMRRLQ
jgi:hypothetical protein